MRSVESQLTSERQPFPDAKTPDEIFPDATTSSDAKFQDETIPDAKISETALDDENDVIDLQHDACGVPESRDALASVGQKFVHLESADAKFKRPGDDANAWDASALLARAAAADASAVAAGSAEASGVPCLDVVCWPPPLFPQLIDVADYEYCMQQSRLALEMLSQCNQNTISLRASEQGKSLCFECHMIILGLR